jgi:hypothetical protein
MTPQILAQRRRISVLPMTAGFFPKVARETGVKVAQYDQTSD